jgi:hypothetical protein
VAQKRLEERAGKKPFIGFYMLGAICATIALSLGAAYTTWLGMSKFLPWQIAILLTFAVQFLVFLLAWLVAYAVFHRRTRDGLIYGAAYLIAACFSVAFSYTLLYDRLTGPEVRKEHNALAGRTMRDQALSDIKKAMEKVSERQHADITGGESYKTWRRNAERVIDWAQQSAASIEKFIQAKRDGARAALRELEKRIETATETIGHSKREVDAAIDRANRLEPSVNSARESYERVNDELRQLQNQSDKLAAELKQEETVGGSKRVSRPGRGQIWQELKDNYQGLQPAIFQKKGEVDQARATLEARQKELNAARLARDKGLKESGDATNDLAANEPELKLARDQIGVLRAADSGRVEDVVRQFRESLDRFEKEHAVGHLAMAQAACQFLLDRRREAEANVVLSSAETLRCEEQKLGTSLKTLQAVEERQTAFREQCFTKIETASSESFVQIAEFVRLCIRISELPVFHELGGKFGTIQGLQATLDKEQEFRPDEKKGEDAQHDALALYLRALTDGQPQAYAGITFAIGMELLLLMVAVTGRSMQAQARVESEHSGSMLGNLPSLELEPEESPDGAAIKRVLTSLVPQSGTKESVLDLEAAGLGRDANVRGLLGALVMDREARQVVENGRQIWYISPVGYRMIVDRYRKLQSQRPAARPIFPTGFGPAGQRRAGPWAARPASSRGGASSGQPREEADQKPAQQPWRPQRRFLTDD